ncbi:MAG: B12-binding domain-containing radical SAM protein [Thermodesulfobacteriota bacterium]
MARIILIQPPLSDAELYARGSKNSASIIPPLGLAYIAAYLKAHGHTCFIVDGIAESWSLPEVVSKAKTYDVVGITVMSSYALRAIELLAAVKSEGEATPVIAGGPHVTALPESMLRRGADFAVIGEGEQTMLELVEWLGGVRERAALREIPGIGFLEEGKYVYTGHRPGLEPLDQVPLPDRTLLPMHLYRSSIARATDQPSLSMLTSRGCPGVCSFCSKLTFGTHTRYFSTERIIEEFFVLRDRYGARDVGVFDDNFVANPEVALAVCDGLRRRNFGRTFSVEARIDGVDRQVLTALKASGCTFIAYGIESGSQRVLDYVNKRISKDQIREVIAVTKEIGIPIRGYFMFGFPGETRAEMEETVRFAMELDIEVASFTLFLPLPGTLEYRRAGKTGAFDPEYYLHRLIPEFNFPDSPIYVPEGFTAQELLDFHRQAYNRYYFRPKIILRRLAGIRRPHEVWDLLKGGYTLAANALHKWKPHLLESVAGKQAESSSK